VIIVLENSYIFLIILLVIILAWYIDMMLGLCTIGKVKLLSDIFNNQMLNLEYISQGNQLM
jgi:hypothetical protein